MSEAQTACPPLRGGCPVMLGLLAPSRNSLRSLRSLRSDRRDESVDEARVALQPATLCFSAAPIRPAHAPPAALRAMASA